MEETWGEWWLPGTDERLPGRLVFDQAEGATLTLVGDFSALTRRAWSHPAVFGEAFSGTQLTLLDPFWIERPPPIEGFEFPVSRTVVRSLLLLRGAHVPSAADFVIDHAELRLRGMRDLCFLPAIAWVGVTTGFVGGRDNEPREQRVEVEGGEIAFSYETFVTRSRFGQMTEEDVEVVVRADTGLPIEEFQTQWLDPLQGLVIFAGREPTVLESMVVNRTTESEVHPAIRHGTAERFWQKERIEVLMTLPGLTAETRYDYQRPLVPLAVLGDDAPNFVREWWKLYKVLGSATPVLLSALGSRLFLDNRLLNEMSFAESYHRILHDDPPISAEDHEQYVAGMLATIGDTKTRQHYADRLRYAAEQGQRQRIKSLIRRAKKVVDLGSLNASLADSLVTTRNALTHLDPNATALRDEPLYRAIELLEVVIQVNMLLDLGLTTERVNALVRTSYLNQTPFHPIPD